MDISKSQLNNKPVHVDYLLLVSNSLDALANWVMLWQIMKALPRR